MKTVQIKNKYILFIFILTTCCCTNTSLTKSGDTHENINFVCDSLNRDSIYEIICYEDLNKDSVNDTLVLEKRENQCFTLRINMNQQQYKYIFPLIDCLDGTNYHFDFIKTDLKRNKNRIQLYIYTTAEVSDEFYFSFINNELILETYIHKEWYSILDKDIEKYKRVQINKTVSSIFDLNFICTIIADNKKYPYSII